jgi:ZIP family zinc transporter
MTVESPPILLLAVSGVVVASLVLGGAAAGWVRLPERPASLVTAYGGGLLLGAVALDLLPAADATAGRGWTAAGILAGAAAYLVLDELLTRDAPAGRVRTSGHAAASGAMAHVAAMGDVDRAAASRGQVIAAGIVVDGIPESLALGLAVVMGAGSMGEGGVALLVAVVLGNVTEAYGAAQPLLASGRSRVYAFGLVSGIALLLGAVTVLGGTVLAGAHPAVVGTAQAVAVGAVVAVLSTAVIPYAFRQASSLVAVAVVLGLVSGYLLG